jgi:hypothetical protein
VRWAGRSGRRADVEGSATGSDGLDVANWDLLHESVTAAHRGDPEAHVAALRRLEREVPVDAKAGIYLWYLLRYRIAALLGRRPTPHDLRELGGRIYPEFSKIIRCDQGQLEDMLLTAFEFASEDRKVKGGRAIVMGSAALGVLLEDPEAELAAMRPHLAEWWRRNADEFRDLGLR